jgi:predicted nucleic acid-binding protein
LDSNVFIYAALGNSELGENSVKLLSKSGSRQFYTSFLTLDEVVFVVRKNRDLASAVEIGKAMLEMDGLNFVDVNYRVAQNALQATEKYGLLPRDAIHFASMQEYSLKEIVSEDADFDKLPGIKRLSVVEAEKRLYHP